MSKPWRGAKWFGLLVCVPVAASWMASTRVGVSHSGSHHLIRMVRGYVHMQYSERDLSAFRLSTLGWYVGTHNYWERLTKDGRSLRVRMRQVCGLRLPTCFVSSRKGSPLTYSALIPLWIPFLVSVIPTCILWLLDRRNKIGVCDKCGYDLTGNVSGVCPECGKPNDGQTK